MGLRIKGGVDKSLVLSELSLNKYATRMQQMQIKPEPTHLLKYKVTVNRQRMESCSRLLSDYAQSQSP